MSLPVARAHQRDQALGSEATHHAGLLADGRERRLQPGGHVNIVKADHAHVAWHENSGLIEAAQHTDRRDVVVAGNRGHAGPRRQQGKDGRLATNTGPIACNNGQRIETESRVGERGPHAREADLVKRG